MTVWQDTPLDITDSDSALDWNYYLYFGDGKNDTKRPPIDRLLFVERHGRE